MVGIMVNKSFLWGVAVGLIIPIAYHKFVRAIPGGKGG